MANIKNRKILPPRLRFPAATPVPDCTETSKSETERTAADSSAVLLPGSHSHILPHFFIKNIVFFLFFINKYLLSIRKAVILWHDNILILNHSKNRESYMGGFPKLTILSEQLRGKTFELNKDLHTVGRIEERDICIMDPTISTYHCSFIKSGNTYILKDNNSTNGTRVNNVPITEQELQNSDIIQMGDVEMLYDCEDKTTQTETRTQTGIDLNKNVISSSTIKKMDTISPYKTKETENIKRNQRLILIVLGILVVVILALLGVFLYMVFSTEKPAAAANFTPQKLVQVLKA